MFFNEWIALACVAIVGLASYVSLVILLRLSGKHTLSKMNAFDFVVTVALGSTLASVLLSKDVPLVEGLTVFGLLLLVQFVIEVLQAVRSRGFLSLERVAAVVLETDGSISVMQVSDQSESLSALTNARLKEEKGASQMK